MKKSPGRQWRLPAAVLGIGILVSAGGFRFSLKTTTQSRQRELDGIAAQVRTTLDRTIVASTERLLGLRAHFMLSPGVSRDEFHRLVSLTDSGSTGARAVEWAPLVPAGELASFEQGVRSRLADEVPGAPQFSVHPDQHQASLYVVDYVEPLAGNEAALGFDLGSEPARRAAIEGARDRGTPVASAPLRLVQETASSKGFLIVVPVYDRDSVPVTAPARQRSFKGAALAVFRLDELMPGILGPDPQAEVQIYDVGATVDQVEAPVSSDGLMFSSTGGTGVLSQSAESPSSSLDLNVAGRRWRMLARPGPGFRGANRRVPYGAGGFSLALSAAVAGVVYALTRSRRLAEGLAFEMTATLRQREAEIKRVNEAMKEFVAAAAHDLRGPLTSILGFAATLTRGWDHISDSERRDFLDVIDRQARRMSSLVEDLLTLSRIEAGAIESHPQPLSVGEAIADAVRASPDPSRVEVVSPDHLLVLADPGQLDRMISNYLANAFKYGKDPLRVEASGEGDMVQIVVVDHGEGVPEEFVPRLFSKFSRADSARASQVKGSGLGLSIIEGLARVNHGEAFYRPNEPAGARFGIRLRRAPDPGGS